MNVLRVIFSYLFSCFFNATTARNITLCEGDISFMMPEEYVEFEIKNNVNIGYYAESRSKAIALFAYRNSNFSVSKVLEGLDSCLCDLSKYRLVNTEKEYFWNLTTDYVIRKYESENGQKFASYTRYVTKGAYCFGFWYNSNKEYKDFENLIESVHFSEENAWGQLRLFLSYSHINWILHHISFSFLIIILVGLIVAFARPWKDNMRIIAILALIMLPFLWGFWFLYFIFILFLLCFSLLTSYIDWRMTRSNKSSDNRMGDTSTFNGIVDGIDEFDVDVDIDFD